MITALANETGSTIFTPEVADAARMLFHELCKNRWHAGEMNQIVNYVTADIDMAVDCGADMDPNAVY